MRRLREYFSFSAAGTVPALDSAFQRAAFPYDTYPLNRRVNPIADLCTLISLVLLFRRHRPDLIHAFDTKPCVFARLAAKLTGVPVVVGTLPGLGSLYVQTDLATRVVRTIYERLQKLVCYLSDMTIFQNHDDAQQFVARGLAPVSKITVIPGSGVRTDLLDPNKISQTELERVRAELSIPPDALLITMIARLIRSKGVAEFAAAAQMVHHQYPETSFLLVGPADEGSVDRLTPEELSQLPQSIIRTGTREDIPVILAASDVFVLPSFYREGIPRVLLEAAAMGLPLVTTDSPGCKEVVKDGVNGFLVPVRDPVGLAGAILRLVKSPEMRQRFGRESRQYAETRFDLSVVAERTRLLYQELLSSKGLLVKSEE